MGAEQEQVQIILSNLPEGLCIYIKGYFRSRKRNLTSKKPARNKYYKYDYGYCERTGEIKYVT